MKNPLYWALLGGMSVLLMEQGECCISIFHAGLWARSLLSRSDALCCRSSLATRSFSSFLFHVCSCAALFADLSSSLNQEISQEQLSSSCELAPLQVSEPLALGVFLHLFLLVRSSSCQSSSRGTHTHTHTHIDRQEPISCALIPAQLCSCSSV